MMSCRESTRLLSRAQEIPLPLKDRLSLRMHLALCSGCRDFSRQIDFLRRATRIFGQVGEAAAHPSKDENSA